MKMHYVFEYSILDMLKLKLKNVWQLQIGDKNKRSFWVILYDSHIFVWENLLKCRILGKNSMSQVDYKPQFKWLSYGLNLILSISPLGAF